MPDSMAQKSGESPFYAAGDGKMTVSDLRAKSWSKSTY
jgi:hypothetical protein